MSCLAPNLRPRLFGANQKFTLRSRGLAVLLLLALIACDEPDPRPGEDASGARLDATAQADADFDAGVALDAAFDAGAPDGAEDAGPLDASLDPCGAGTPVIDLVIVDFWIVDRPKRRAELASDISAHFARATGCRVELRVLEVVEFEVPTHDISEILADYDYIDPIDAQRLWYYENQNVDMILSDISGALAASGVLVPSGAVVVALSEPQFEASAYYIEQDAYGLEPLIIIESHTLGGWTLGSGYTTVANGALYLADEIVHELGHFMGLRHACASCFTLGDYSALVACCAACPHAQDVMSYCRTRVRPEDTETRVFSSCTLDWVESGFVPAYGPAYETSYQAMACEN